MSKLHILENHLFGSDDFSGWEEDEYELVLQYRPEEVLRRLVEFEVTPTPLINQVEARVHSTNRYVAEYINKDDLAPKKLRRRLLLCAVMAGIPSAIATGVAFFLKSGVINNVHTISLAYLVIGGAAITAGLALVAAIEGTFEAFVHQWVVCKLASEESSALTIAINELVRTNRDVGKELISHLKNYQKLSQLIARLAVNQERR